LLLEYRRIAEEIYPSKLILTNFNHELPQDWPAKTIENIIMYKASVKDIDIPKDKICLMDSEASELLEPNDNSSFSYFLLGGILGNGINIRKSSCSKF
jgi:ribosome biogenesis SPOUT family RNA methylase Rps3